MCVYMYMYVNIIYIYNMIQHDIKIYHDIFWYLMQSLHNVHINVLPVPGAHPVAQRIHAAVPPAPPGGGPAAKLWPPLNGAVPPPE